jgi:hypothetical protein
MLARWEVFPFGAEDGTQGLENVKHEFHHCTISQPQMLWKSMRQKFLS